MLCDHAASRASVLAFREATMFIGFQELGAGETAILGQCRGCKSTIAIEIAVARGSVVHGEIEAAPPPVRPMDPNQCPRNRWCADIPGHEGDCLPPF